MKKKLGTSETIRNIIYYYLYFVKIEVEVDGWFLIIFLNVSAKVNNTGCILSFLHKSWKALMFAAYLKI